MTKETKDKSFYESHKEIIWRLRKEAQKGEGEIANGYVRYSFREDDVLKITLYATNDVAKLTTLWGNLDTTGLDFANEYTNDHFLTKEETKNWGKKEWKTYIDKVVKYFLKIMKFSENLCFTWEGYGNYCVNYPELTTKLLMINGLDEGCSAWVGQYGKSIGEYAVNVFAAFPPDYDEIDGYLKSLEILEKVMKLSDKYGINLNGRPNIDREIIAKTGKEILKHFSGETLENIAPCIYTDAGDNDVPVYQCLVKNDKKHEETPAYKLCERLAVRQNKGRKYEIWNILKRQESCLMFWYVVMWQTTEDGDKNWDKIEEIYKNPLDYDIDVRKLSTWVGKEREEEYVIDLMTTNGKNGCRHHCKRRKERRACSCLK